MPDPSSPVRNPLRGTALVLLAAGLWGTLGTVYRLGMEQYGLTPVAVVFYRAAITLALVTLAIIVTRRRVRLPGRDLALLALYGALGVTAFYLCYIYAVRLTGVTTAVVLLYTAPAWVALLAWRVLGERPTWRTGVALGLTLMGAALVAGANDPARLRTDALGIACGLGAAFTYALYSIFGKLVIGRGIPLPVMLFWMFAVGSTGLAVAGPPEQLLDPGDQWGAWALLALLTLGPTLGALVAYTAALRHLDAGPASIIATFEPLVATTLAFVVLHEAITPPQLLGGAAILGAVLVLRLPTRRRS